jgi:hypothetical protein
LLRYLGLLLWGAMLLLNGHKGLNSGFLRPIGIISKMNPVSPRMLEVPQHDKMAGSRAGESCLRLSGFRVKAATGACPLALAYVYSGSTASVVPTLNDPWALLGLALLYSAVSLGQLR